LRYALGWSYLQIAAVMGVNVRSIYRLIYGDVTKPSIYFICQLRLLESTYEDIINYYKVNPVRRNRYNRWRRPKYRNRLWPLHVRPPYDPQTLVLLAIQHKAEIKARNQRAKSTPVFPLKRSTEAIEWRRELEGNQAETIGRPDYASR